MTSKFWYLTGMSFKKKAKTKWFLVANIILLVALVGIMNIDSIISFFGGNFDETRKIVVLDHTGKATEVFKKNLNTINGLAEEEEQEQYEVTVTEKSEKEMEKELKDSDTVLLVFDSSDSQYLKARLVSDKTMNTSFYQTLVQVLSATKTEVAMSETDVSPEELNKIVSPIEIERIMLNDQNNEEENSSIIMGAVFPTVILPFFILVIFLVQMIGTEINEEKSTRSMEIIISNVSPKTHFFSKIVASNAFVLLQGGLLILYSGIGIWVKNILAPKGASSSITAAFGDIWQTLTETGFADKMYYIIPLTLILLVLSFIAYSLVAGILASMTVNMEDFQQIQTPIMMICLLGYYLAIMAGMFDGSLFIRICSYIPFISCLLSPSLLMIGQIGVIDVLVSIAILAGFIFVAVRYGLRIYKIGILNYSADKMWKRIFTAAKTKEM